MAGGGGCEWYFGYKHAHNDLDLEDWRSRDRMWDQTRHAVEFFREHLPFTKMSAVAGHLSREDGWVFARPGHVYAMYLPPTAADTPAPEPAKLWLPAAEYTVSWFDPQGGGTLRNGSVRSVSGPGYRTLGEPPGNTRRDWVALVKLSGHPPRDVPPPPQ